MGEKTDEYYWNFTSYYEPDVHVLNNILLVQTICGIYKTDFTKAQIRI